MNFLAMATLKKVRSCLRLPISMMPRFSLKLTLARLRTGIVRVGSLLRSAAVITAAERSKDPTLTIPIRSLANVNFNEKRGIIEMGRRKQERTFFNVAMAKKFMQTVLVADALAELQRANLTTSLREIYYRTKHTMKGSRENTFDGQNESG